MESESRLIAATDINNNFFHQILDWASHNVDILAVALVGSHARGAARADSDIDLVLPVGDPEKYLADEVWPGQFGTVLRRQIEDYGRVTSLRVWYDDGREVEYGFAKPEWAAPPLDKGTRRVIRDGMRILFERARILSRAAGG